MFLPTLALWDLDGTIADTEPINMRAHQLVVESLGAHCDVEALMLCAGQSLQKVSMGLVEKHHLNVDYETYRGRWLEVRHELVERDGVRFMPGAAELLTALQRKRVVQGLVTASWRVNMDHVVQKLRIKHYFMRMVCRENVQKSKPDPEAYLLAHAQFGHMKHTVAFEDSNSGTQAARAAGLTVIGVRTAQNTAQALESAHAIVDLTQTQHVLEVISELMTRRK